MLAPDGYINKPSVLREMVRVMCLEWPLASCNHTGTILGIFLVCLDYELELDAKLPKSASFIRSEASANVTSKNLELRCQLSGSFHFIR